MWAASSEIERARAFRTFELGDQKILLVRDDQGVLQGFHNTCRHRGAALCRESEGSLRAGTIVCPYHAWIYNLQGDLLRTSSKAHASGFDVADYPLYKDQRQGMERIHVRGIDGSIRRPSRRSSTYP